MKNFLASHKVIWLFLAIGVVAVVVIVVTALADRSGNQADVTQNPQAKIPELKVDHKAVPDSQLPNQFPAEIAQIEPNAKVLDNFNSTASNGNYQATRVYQSTKTPDDNYKAFDAFFKKGGWATLSASNTAADKSITAKKGNTIIQAIFYTNTVSKASTVKVNVTILPDSSPAAK